MFQIPQPPPQPPWEGLHVVLVHLPIGLLMIAPLFVFLAMLLGRRGWWCSLTALILLGLGTVGAYYAVETGKAARDVVEDGPDEMWGVLEQHEELAEQTLTIYVVFTIVFLVLFVFTRFGRLNQASVLFPIHLLVLLALAGASLFLANTSHLGGRLVHQYGVHAVLAEEQEPVAEEEEAVDEEEEAVDEEEEAVAEEEESAAMDDADTGESAAVDGEEAKPDSGESTDAAEAKPVEASDAAAAEKPDAEPAAAEASPKPEMPAEGPAAPPENAPPAEESPAEPSPETPPAAPPAADQPAPAPPAAAPGSSPF